VPNDLGIDRVMAGTSGRLLHGQVALITGAARGLGRAIAHRFAEDGAIGIALDIDGMTATAAAPTGWLSGGVDVRHQDDLGEAVSKVVERFGGLDVVVANAGLVPAWEETEDIDL